MSAAPAVAAKFGALQHRDYRRYFVVAVIGMTAESVEHVISYWVIPFDTSMLGLRAGSGLTVGVLGAAIGVEWSLALSAVAVVVVGLGLLAADIRRDQ